MKRHINKPEANKETVSTGCLPLIILILMIIVILLVSYRNIKRDFFNIINGAADVQGFFSDIEESYIKNITSPDFIMPLNGNITSPYGERLNPFDNTTKEKHTGIDIDTNITTDVSASADGKVEKTGFDERFGNYIIIRHNKIYSTCYAHLEKPLVKTGDVVKSGEIIAIAGETGNATGKHLHFEIRKEEERVDPLKYLLSR